MKEDYIKLCKPRTCMVMQNNAWMIVYFFKQWFSFFYKSIPKEIYQQNCHLLILDGYGSHVTMERFEQAIKFGLIMVTFNSHISHTL
jgi:hypothetical protein